MRPIRKGNEPAFFSQWKVGASPDWRPSYASLGGETKRNLTEALAREQGFLCCYCGCRIPPHHIEHLRPQHGPHGDPARDLDYDNLLASCESLDEAGHQTVPRRCGHRKDKWWDARLLVSPLDPHCASYFVYGSDGSIRPAPRAPDAEAAKETLQRLGLDTLTARRKKALEPILLSVRTGNDLRSLRSLCEEPDAQGQLVPFASAIASVLDQYLGPYLDKVRPE